ncbi:RIO1 family-domain-containing protein [Dichotomopilus funicola]|uniref:Serine/threonine-protein kinase RIO1 n=1 Tax=Dichotomopilus funicola TaxID=1934379 RepID=A0AAN6V1V7_9PEZI|nr:RIO1 family-domain-containing protein [Dichotomopilus funicola]
MTSPPPVEPTALATDDPAIHDDSTDLEDIFDSADEFEIGDHDTEGGASLDPAAPNPQGEGSSLSKAPKPTANTSARIDDQVAELSKHASKIRLDNVKQSQVREKDKADRATAELVLDNRTRMILLQMINRGFVSEVHGAISTGKEANVYGAVLYPENADEPTQKAIKVYKTAILGFKDRERYITGDHRFKGGVGKGNNRKMIEAWAQKEFRNLNRIYDNGIPCPEPITYKKHVLVMGFLGDKRGYAYPRLRDARLVGDNVEEQWHSLYVKLLGIMRRLYQVCELVHADLSEYNILYHDKELYIIDVSQSVGHDHPRALEFLRMDIKNVGDYFRRQGVDTLQDRTVFNFITATEDPTMEPQMSEAIERLYKSRPAVAETDEAIAALEVDNEVFRNQYIPRTLDQVYELEQDAGEHVDKQIYQHMLADHVVDNQARSDAKAPVPATIDHVEDKDANLSNEDGTGSEGDDDSSEVDESLFEKGRPRGRKHEDKDDKRQHKQAVKEAKREKRKEKMPKSVKKKIVSSTSRRKK